MWDSEVALVVLQRELATAEANHGKVVKQLTTVIKEVNESLRREQQETASLRLALATAESHVKDADERFAGERTRSGSGSWFKRPSLRTQNETFVQMVRARSSIDRCRGAL